jgi:YD repeat-containing protein
MPLARAGVGTVMKVTVTAFSFATILGRVIQEWTAPENSSHYVYDGLGRVVVKIDPKTGSNHDCV